MTVNGEEDVEPRLAPQPGDAVPPAGRATASTASTAPSTSPAATPIDQAATAVRTRKPRRVKLDQRTLAERYPAWGPATLGLLVVGVVVGFLTLGAVGRDAMQECLAVADPAVCNPRTEGFVLALPILATAAGLVISLIGGRILIRYGRSPMLASAIGWAVFVVASVVSYAVAV